VIEVAGTAGIRYEVAFIAFGERVLRRTVFLFLTFFVVSTASGANPAGFKYFRVPASQEGAALEGGVWYPADAGGTLTTIGENPILVGQPVRFDAPVSRGRHGLVVLSHGYSGHWNNQGWLAVDLVRQGYVVVAVNHPGTTATDMNTATAARLWARPRDISRSIDALFRDPAWSDIIAADQLAAIGHSLGGWTVMELAGARFDPDRFDADCKAHKSLAACDFFQKIGGVKDAASRAALARSLKDTRIKAIVSLDLGLAGGLDPSSLRKIDKPVLVIGAGVPNGQIPAALESRRLAGFLPAATTRHVEIPGAAHFSFLSVCKPGGAALLAKESPDDAIVCADGNGADRASIHRQVADEIIRFLAASLTPSGK
jgi:predicted dienelactone hydrolase